jgi:hypothetical protein
MMVKAWLGTDSVDILWVVDLEGMATSRWLILNNYSLFMRKSIELLKRKKSSSTVTSNTSKKLHNYSQKKVNLYPMFRGSVQSNMILTSMLEGWKESLPET